MPRRLRGATLVHPGAASAARRWPVDRWIEVARAEQRSGRAVMITGGRATRRPRRARSRLPRSVPATHVYAGRTNLRELAALVAAAGRVVCGDTGVAHLATAYRRPSVTLFGPVAPAIVGPAAAARITACSGTAPSGDPHADRPDAGLLAIPPQRVIAALAGLSA